jgi:hypothetical protein
MQSDTRRTLIVLGAAVVLALTLAAFAVWAQLPVQSSKYKPTDLQLLRLQVKQRDAQLAQVALRDAQQQFQSTLAALQQEADKVRDENKWPATVQFSPDTVSFSEQPAPATPTTPTTPPAPAAKQPQ